MRLEMTVRFATSSTSTLRNQTGVRKVCDANYGAYLHTAGADQRSGRLPNLVTTPRMTRRCEKLVLYKSNNRRHVMGETTPTARQRWTCGGCDLRWASTKIEHCPVCHRSFRSTRLADQHRVGPFDSTRRCLTDDELREKGAAPRDAGRDGTIWTVASSWTPEIAARFPPRTLTTDSGLGVGSPAAQPATQPRNVDEP